MTLRTFHELLYVNAYVMFNFSPVVTKLVSNQKHQRVSEASIYNYEGEKYCKREKIIKTYRANV